MMGRGGLILIGAIALPGLVGAQQPCSSVPSSVGPKIAPDPTIARMMIADNQANQDRCEKHQASVLRKLTDPTATTTALSPVNALQLSAKSNEKAKTVTAKIGVLDGNGKGSSLGTMLTFDGPLDDSDDRSTLVNVSDRTSLSDATKVGLSLHWYNWTPALDTAGLRRYCNQIKPLTSAKDEKSPNIAWCFAGSDKVPKQFSDSLAGFITDVGIPITAEVNARYGRQDVKYADLTTLNDSTVHKAPYSLGAAIGWFFIPQSTVFEVSYDRVHAIKPGKSTQLCVPVAAVAGALKCRTTTLGGPKSEDRNVVGVGIRRTFGPGMGVGIRAQHDWTDNIQTIEVPLYFLGTKATAPSGGIVLSWSTEHHQLSLSGFVGVLANALTSAPSP